MSPTRPPNPTGTTVVAASLPAPLHHEACAHECATCLLRRAHQLTANRELLLQESVDELLTKLREPVRVGNHDADTLCTLQNDALSAWCLSSADCGRLVLRGVCQPECATREWLSKDAGARLQQQQQQLQQQQQKQTTPPITTLAPAVTTTTINATTHTKHTAKPTPLPPNSKKHLCSQGRGILDTSTGVCCAMSCDRCHQDTHGVLCAKRHGGAEQCCPASIGTSNICSASVPPPCHTGYTFRATPVPPPINAAGVHPILGDPCAPDGIMDAHKRICCDKACGACDDKGCQVRPGGKILCCPFMIRKLGATCDKLNTAPCIIQ